jgi:hypothetical protein
MSSSKNELENTIQNLITIKHFDEVISVLVSNTGKRKLIKPSEPDIDFWNKSGLFFLRNGMNEMAERLYYSLFEVQMEEQKTGERLHKGMALYNCGISIANIGDTEKAKKIITFAYIEDCISFGKNALIKLGYKTLLNNFGIDPESLDGIFTCANDRKIYSEFPPKDPEEVYRTYYDNPKKWNNISYNFKFYSLDLSFFKSALDSVKSAVTKAEKKNSLENLSKLLFNSIEGFTVKPNKRTSTSEIDRIVRNYSSHPLLASLGNHILIECKNWTVPVDSKSIRDFVGKIEDHKYKCGILLSKNGITGSARKDAVGTIRDKFRDKGIFVLVFADSDLLEISDGQNPIDILERKYEEVRFM